ncbi:MAG: rhodanese-like domain-containing protein [Deltaproteobacteria bacterium]|nr:rhodanese-like domain-containing protein [Deltaproteobacteria bacterium]
MKEIKYKELVNMIEPGKKHPVLVNVLPRNDFLQNHIPGSINIPVNELDREAKKLLATHDWIVVYCANNGCDASHQAAEKLGKLGFENVFRFTGGVEEWKKSNSYCCTEEKSETSKTGQRYSQCS